MLKLEKTLKSMNRCVLEIEIVPVGCQVRPLYSGPPSKQDVEEVKGYMQQIAEAVGGDLHITKAEMN